jgi:hypothetical protein
MPERRKVLPDVTVARLADHPSHHADHRELPGPDDRGHDDSHRPDMDDRPRAWTPWLVIRYTTMDDGQLRPIADNTVFWASPDIWIESSDPLGNAVAGEPNFVHARVFNLGKSTSSPTRVEFYWADPSLGLGPGHMTLIGTEWVEVGHLEALPVRCNTPWVPGPAGHQCLMVNCDNMILDKIQYPLQPKLDRHVAQRNVTVVQAKPGQTITFSVFVNNISPMMAKTTITARVEHVSIARRAMQTLSHNEIVHQVLHYYAGAGQRRSEPDGAHIVRAVTGEAGMGHGAAQIESRLSEEPFIVPAAGSRRSFAQLLLEQTRSSERPADAERDFALHEVTMGASEQRRLDLQLSLPAGAQPDEFVAFHLMQSIEGLSVGGYTIVAAIHGAPARG